MNTINNRSIHNRQQWGNTVNTLLIMAGLYILLGFTALMIFGSAGLLVIVAVGVANLLVGRRFNDPDLLAKHSGAYRLSPASYYNVHKLTERLAIKAGLPSVPKLYGLPSQQMNAFAVGDRDNSAIVLSEGLLYTLTLREINSILGHEIAHLKNSDLQVIGLADMTTRLINSFTLLGQLSMLTAVVLFGYHISLFWFLLVTLLPTLSVLLQLALSRTREFEADRTSAVLTNDPVALASALKKIDHAYKMNWKKLLIPGWYSNQPPLLRTHPPSSERIKRLLELVDNQPTHIAAKPSYGNRAIHYGGFGAGYHR